MSYGLCRYRLYVAGEVGEPTFRADWLCHFPANLVVVVDFFTTVTTIIHCITSTILVRWAKIWILMSEVVASPC